VILIAAYALILPWTLLLISEVEASWSTKVAYMAIGWAAIHVAVITLRGAVLYVVVGKFLPRAGLRGWLLL
jgi:hypothetical protein